MARDIGAFCHWYEEEIEARGGIDIQILGIGSDGHIAFNEPGSSLGSRTRLKTLTELIDLPINRAEAAGHFTGKFPDAILHLRHGCGHTVYCFEDRLYGKFTRHALPLRLSMFFEFGP